MKHLLIIFLLCVIGVLSALQPIPPLAKVHYETEWYEQRAKEWQKETKKSPDNAEAWINYYRATRYAIKYKKQLKGDPLLDIINQMEKHIPETFEYYYARYEHKNSVEDAKYLWKALKLRPDTAELLYDAIATYAKKGQTKKFSDACIKLYYSKDIFNSLLNFNYNMLVSVEQDGILLTHGDNDTYPAWVLQEAKDIRKDVTILNISLCYSPDYLNYWMKRLGAPKLEQYRVVSDLVKHLNKHLPKRNIYIASTMGEAKIKDISDKFYNIGIVSQYSDTRFDNIALLKLNLEENYRMDYLDNNWYTENHISDATVKRAININYIPAIIMLSDHYKLSKDEHKAQNWLNLAKNIAENSGNKQIIEYLQRRDK